jgi:hypothetical protein
MTDRYVTELNAIVYDCTTKHNITITEDGDGMDLIELKYMQPKAEGDSIVFPWIDPEMARQVAAGLIRVADHIDARKSKK